MGKSKREAVWGKANTRDKQTLVPSPHILIFSEFNCSKCQCFEKSYFCSSGRCLSTSGKRQVFNVRVGLLLSVCEVSQVLRMSSPPPWTHPASALIVLEKNCCRQKVPTLTFCQKPFSAVRQRQQRLLGLNSSAEGDFHLLPSVSCQPPLPPSQGPPLPPHLELLNFCCISRISCYCCSFLSYSCLFACFALMHTKYLYS